MSHGKVAQRPTGYNSLPIRWNGVLGAPGDTVSARAGTVCIDPVNDPSTVDSPGRVCRALGPRRSGLYGRGMTSADTSEMPELAGPAFDRDPSPAYRWLRTHAPVF